MTDKTSLGDRMKAYEKAYDFKYPIRLPLILRLDGVHFHTNVKKWKCKKPFDKYLVGAMQYTAMCLCMNIAGAQIAYTQSDEITILIRDDMTHKTQPWFGKELNKILSVSSSMASNAFNEGYGLEEVEEKAMFDCRGFVVPEQEIFNVFLWRQRDCEKNSKQMLGRSEFSDKQLKHKNGNDIQDMLMTQKGINWNDLETRYKRGSCIVKKDTPKEIPKRDEQHKIIEGEFETIHRPFWSIDEEIPIFSKDTEYINRYAKITKE